MGSEIEIALRHGTVPGEFKDTFVIPEGVFHLNNLENGWPVVTPRHVVVGRFDEYVPELKFEKARPTMVYLFYRSSRTKGPTGKIVLPKTPDGEYYQIQQPEKVEVLEHKPGYVVAQADLRTIWQHVTGKTKL